MPVARGLGLRSRDASRAGGALGVEKKEEDAGKSTFMLPRELEEMKLKEKVKEPPKGAPAYFDTMTKVRVRLRRVLQCRHGLTDPP
jgi:hypothetical protein